MSKPSISITADEVNCLIYAYFVDSGFTHSSFTLATEAQLERSSYFRSKHIRRGELVDLLSKALLYIEVETHFNNGYLGGAKCENGFRLLETHVCKGPGAKAGAEGEGAIKVVGAPPPAPVSLKVNFPPPPIPAHEAVVGTGVPLTAASLASLNNYESAKTSLEPSTSAKITVDAKGKRKATPVQGDESRAEKRQRTEAKPTKDKPSTSQAPTPATAKPKKPRMLKDDYDVHPCVHLLSGHESEVFVTAWNPTHSHLMASGAKNSSVIIWNVPGSPLNHSTSTDPTSSTTTSILQPTQSVSTSPIDPSRTTTVIPGTTNPPAPYTPLITMKFSPNKSADVNSVSWSPDGTLLAIASYDAALRVFRKDGSLWFENYEHKDPIYAACFSPDGKYLLTASLDNTSGLWNIQEKTLIRMYRSHKDCCIDVEWIDNEHFVSGGMDSKMYLHSIEGRTSIEVLGGHTGAINQIKRSPSGNFFAAGSDDGNISIWTLRPREQLVANPKATEPQITNWRLGYDSLHKRLHTRYPLSLGLAITLAPATPLFLKGHKKAIATIAWSPTRVDVRNIGSNFGTTWNGSEYERELVCSVSFDGSAMIWDAEDGKCLKVMGRHDKPVFGVAFSPCARFVATGDADGFVIIYSVNGTATSKVWSWFAGSVKTGAFELNWQRYEGLGDRLSVALERKDVAVMETWKIKEIQKAIEDEEATRGRVL